MTPASGLHVCLSFVVQLEVCKADKSKNLSLSCELPDHETVGQLITLISHAASNILQMVIRHVSPLNVVYKVHSRVQIITIFYCIFYCILIGSALYGPLSFLFSQSCRMDAEEHKADISDIQVPTVGAVDAVAVEALMSMYNHGNTRNIRLEPPRPLTPSSDSLEDDWVPSGSALLQDSPCVSEP